MSRQIVNLSLKGHRVIIKRWDEASENWIDPLDVSQWIDSGSWGYESWSLSGIRRQNGSLELMGDPFVATPESFDPRKNPRRWKRGNQGTIEFFDEDQWKQVATFYILKFPLPPYPGKPTLSLEIGCKLSLLDYRVPPSTGEVESGVEMGSPASVQSVVAGFLNAAGIDALGGSIAGMIDYPPPKNFSSSWIEEAGKLAYAYGSYLRCNAEDQVVAVPMPDLYNMNRFKVLRLGRNEAKCEPIGGGEPVAEKLIITGTKTEVLPTPSKTVTVEEDYAPASVFELGAEGNCIARQAITTEEGTVVRTRSTIVREPVGAVRPRANANRLALTISSIEDENFYFGGGEEGRLYKRSLIVQEPLAKSLAEMNVSDPGIKPSIREQSSYSYDDQAGAREISVFRQEQAGRIAPKSFRTFGIIDPETSLSPDDLVQSGGQVERWAGDHDADKWTYRQRQYDNANRKYDLKFVSLQTRLSNIVVSSKSVTSNAGGAQPPQAERRTALYYKKETPLETEIELDPIGGTAFSPREETIDIPYAQSETQLQQAALPYAIASVGRDLSIQWEMAPDSDWLSDPDPVLRLDVQEPDGSVFAYWVDNLSLAFDQQKFYIGGDGIYLGLVDTASPDEQHIIYDPVTGEPIDPNTMEPIDPDSDEAIPGSGEGRIQAAYTRRLNFAVRGGGDAVIFSSPIPLIAPQVEFVVRTGGDAAMRYQLPEIEFAAQSGGDTKGQPTLLFPIQGTGAAVLELITDNITQPSLTLQLQSSGMTGLYEDAEFPGDQFLTTWLNEAISGASMRAPDGYSFTPFYVPNFFGAGLHAAAFREAEHYGNSNQSLEDNTQFDNLTPKRWAEDFISATACTIFLVIQLDDPALNGNVGSATEDSEFWIGAPTDASPGDRDQILNLGTLAIASKYLQNPLDSNDKYFKIWLLHQDSTYSNYRLESGPVSAGAPILITAWHETGTLYLQINNGTPVSTTNAAGATVDLSSYELAIGGYANDSAAFKLGAGLIYNASLDSTTRAAIQDELNTLYGFWS